MQSNWSAWYRNKGYKVEPEIPLINKMLKTNSKILDIGCGHGRHVIYFAGKGHDVFGIDSYRPILRQLERDLLTNNLHANLKCRDINRGLPYPDGYFDLIIATRSIHHTKDKQLKRIFKEIDRILKTNGLLFLQIPDYEGSKEVEKTWIEYGKPVMYKWIERHTYVHLSGPEKGVPHHALDKNELSVFLRKYKTIKMHIVKSHYHGYCVIAKKVHP